MQFRKALDHLQAGGQIRRSGWPAGAHLDIPHDNPTIILTSEGSEWNPMGGAMLKSDWEYYIRLVEAPAVEDVPLASGPEPVKSYEPPPVLDVTPAGEAMPRRKTKKKATTKKKGKSE